MFSRFTTNVDKENVVKPDSAVANKQKKTRFQISPAAEDEKSSEADIRPVSAKAISPKSVFDQNSRQRLTDLKIRLHRKLIDDMNLAVIDEMAPDEFRRNVAEMVRFIVQEERLPLNEGEKQRLVDDIINELLGLGPLEPLLADHTVTDILVNGAESVFVERFGLLEPSDVQFKDNRHLMRIIQKIVSAVGRRVDESQPMVDARLADGSRVNAIIPPLAVDGPLLSIRKFATERYDLAKLVENGALPEVVADLLRGIVKSRRNVLISGGTGSGKTTMLNAMSAFIDNRERIVTIEDAAELQLQQDHIARLETRPPNIEGKGEMSQRDLLKNALRMRPDRIIVGEVRGGEAFDMLQSMNTGHEGSMTTIHSNSCRDALGRLEQMIMMSGLELHPRAMRGQIASAIHIILQLERLSDGRRRLTSLSEISGMESDIITMQEIIRFERISTDEDGKIHGRFVATGVRPKVMEEFQTRGINFSLDNFKPNAVLG